MIDLVLKNGNVVFPDRFVRKVDIGITDGKISHIGGPLGSAQRTIDVEGKFVFPGAIDSHFHAGIYRPLSEDARTESSSAISGGVTTILSYFRTGRYYMDSSDPYLTLFPKVLSQSLGNFYTDYGYHLAPMTRTHLDEIPALVKEYGVTTFKFYMFLRGTDTSDNSKSYLLSGDPYDLGHLYNVMKRIASIRDEIKTVRLSIHAEDPEIIRASSEDVHSSSEQLKPLQQLSRARPAEAERLAIVQALELALYTSCPINILHLSSSLGLDTITSLKAAHPLLDVVVETGAHYLLLNEFDGRNAFGKIYPPIRTQQDSEALWEGIARRQIETLASDHCCSNTSYKDSDIWSARPGFGSTELLLPSLITEGHFKRGLPLEFVATLLTRNPAKYFGLEGVKGDIEIGYDADLVVCDLGDERVVEHKNLHSAQNFSPFDGLRLKGWAEMTILRGTVVYEDGKPVGKPSGEYLNRANLLRRDS